MRLFQMLNSILGEGKDTLFRKGSLNRKIRSERSLPTRDPPGGEGVPPNLCIWRYLYTP